MQVGGERSADLVSQRSSCHSTGMIRLMEDRWSETVFEIEDGHGKGSAILRAKAESAELCNECRRTYKITSSQPFDLLGQTFELQVVVFVPELLVWRQSLFIEARRRDSP